MACIRPGARKKTRGGGEERRKKEEKGEEDGGRRRHDLTEGTIKDGNSKEETETE